MTEWLQDNLIQQVIAYLFLQVLPELHGCSAVVAAVAV